MFGFNVVKAAGQSMSPAVLDGAYLLTKHRRRYRVNDIVHVHHVHYGNIVKRIVSGNHHTGFYVSGDNAASVSVDQMGLINTAHILGKVLFILNPSIGK